MSVFARFKPDTREFKRDAERQLKSIDLSAASEALGQRSGAAASAAFSKVFGEGVEKGTQRSYDKTTPKAKTSGQKAAQSYAQGFGQRLNKVLGQLKLPEIDLKADATNVLASLATTRERLTELAENGANIEVRLDARKALADLTRMGKQLEPAAEREGKKTADAFGKGFDDSSVFSRVIAISAAKLTLLTASVAGATPTLLSFTGAVLPAVGALNLLPAAIAGVTAANLTLKVAAAGTLEAINKGFTGTEKEYAKALDALPPAAAEFVTSIVSVKDSLGDLREQVSERFFVSLQDDIEPLTKTLFPLFRQGLLNLAGPLGQLGGEFAETIRGLPVLRTIPKIFDDTATAVVNLESGIRPLVNGIFRLIGVTSSELPELAFSLANGAEAAGNFLSELANSGRATAQIAAAKQVFSDLGGIIGNVGSIIGSVFRAATANSSTLLGNLRALTGQAAAFLKTGQGSTALVTIFATMNQLGASLRVSLGAVLPAIAEGLSDLGPAIATAAAPAGQLIAALAPAIPALASITAQVVRFLTPALTVVATLLGQNEGLVRALTAAFIAWRVVLVTTSAVLAVQAAGGLIAFARTLPIVTAATRAATAAQWLWNAALTANPIGIVIVAIGALVAAVVWLYQNNETARKIILQVWAAIKTAIGAVVTWITGTAVPFLVKAWNVIATGATWLWQNGIKPAFDAIVGFLRTYIFPVFQFWLDRVIRPVFGFIGTIVSAWWSYMQLVFNGLKAILQNVVFPVINFLWQNVVKPVFAFIQRGIQAAWIIIQITFKAWVSYLQTFVFPAIRFLWEKVVKPVFGFIGAAISSWWNNIAKPIFALGQAAFKKLGEIIQATWKLVIKPVFDLLSSVIQTKIAPAFRTGVSAITTAWDKVREAARKPVAFVVNQVLNPLIGGFNKIAGAFGIKDRVDTIKGFASGGQVPGTPSPHRDNRLAMVADTGRIIKVATGEMITNVKSTMANTGILRAINRKRGKVTHEDVDPFLDGYRRGGKVGEGDGIGDFFTKVKNGLSGAGELISNPAGALRRIAEAAIRRIPGGGTIRDSMVGAGNKVLNGMITWLKDKVGLGGSLGGGNVFGGWRGMQRLISARFPGLGLISGLRPGATTLSGKRSYHALGRAVDYPPSRALAMWWRATFGRNTKELISPYNDLNLLNGRPHRYTGAIWNQHNFAGGNAHVHIAARLGGIVDRLSGITTRLANSGPARLMDRGGRFPSGTTAVNRSGYDEHVLTGGPDGDMAQMIDLLAAILTALRGLGVDVATALQSNTNRAATTARTLGTATRRA